MNSWTAFDHIRDYPFDAINVKKHWHKLHAGDQEPLPKNAKVLAAWVLFHRGEFENAVEMGLKAGTAGITVANKAACIYASYLEPQEKVKLNLLMEVANRAAAQAIEEPNNANAFYWHGYALGRYSQGISVAKALAQGIGSKVKSALESTIQLQPLHADAHIALGAFHAEVIDKVGALIGNMTYGAKKEACLRLFQQGLELTPKSTIARMEFANALVILEGDCRLEDAAALYQQVASTKALDAMERLEVELARGTSSAAS
jgi:tetratricopeptide (TPR) repeat protein